MSVGDRSVAVRLMAETSQYVSGMGKAAGAAARTEAATRKVGDATGASASKAATAAGAYKTLGNIMLYTFGYNLAQAAMNVGRAALKMVTDFEDAMARLAAASMAGADELGLMRDAALDAGTRTAFSASQAADAMTELAKAGVSTADILSGALDGALALAAAGELEVGLAAETAATAMVQFGLAGSDVTHIADLLAAGAGKAQGDVKDLALALRQGGQVASMVGWSFEETTASLTAFASAGLLSSDAGTSLKTMLLRLANPSNEAAELMRDLGIRVYDSAGNMRGATSLAGELTRSMGGLDDATRNAAMGTIFGTDATRAANVIMSQGVQGMLQWEVAVNDTGYAAEVAARKMDTLTGDSKKLNGALTTLVNDGGSGVNQILREITQGLTGTVNWLNRWGEATQGRFDETQERLGSNLRSNMNLFEGYEAVVWDVYNAFGLYSDKQREAEVAADKSAEAQQRHNEQLRGLNSAVSSATGGITGVLDPLQALAEEAANAEDEIKALKDSITDLGQVNLDEDAAVDALASAAIKARKPLELLVDAQNEVAAAQAELAEASTDAERESAEAALARARETLALAQASITLEGNTEAALENRDAFRDWAEQAKETAATFADGTERGAKAADKHMGTAREAFIKTAIEMGKTEKAAERLADRYGLIEMQVYLRNYEEVIAQAEAIARALNIPDQYVNVFINEQTRETREEQLGSGLHAHNRPVRRSLGGWVHGAGTSTSDSVPMWASRGEYVVRASAAQQFAPILEAINGGTFRGGSSTDNSRHINAQKIEIVAPRPEDTWHAMSRLAVMQ